MLKPGVSLIWMIFAMKHVLEPSAACYNADPAQSLVQTPVCQKHENLLIGC